MPTVVETLKSGIDKKDWAVVQSVYDVLNGGVATSTPPKAKRGRPARVDAKETVVKTRMPRPELVAPEGVTVNDREEDMETLTRPVKTGRVPQFVCE